MIGKVRRGGRVAGLLRYLYGPGKANEHVNPHLVAGWRDPDEVEPPSRADGKRDFARLTTLLRQPCAAIGEAERVWHCIVRAAPQDRDLTDAEWAHVAREVMHRTGLAPYGQEAEAVRWVAVHHGDNHIHIVATLARQDGGKARTSNDFYRLREACRAVEAELGLRRTAPGDRTAAKRPTRAEREKAGRRGWSQIPREALRHQVATAAAAALSPEDFLGRLAQAGVRVRLRRRDDGEVVGYAVALDHHRTAAGALVWYGGGALAADLTWPKLCARWRRTPRDELWEKVAVAARDARDEQELFRRLAEQGVLVRLRHSQTRPGQVTGYAVSLPGMTRTTDRDGRGSGEQIWYAGGRLASWLTLPRLHRRWRTGGEDWTRAEREALYGEAAQAASAAAARIRDDPASAADAAWAAADALRVAAAALGNPVLAKAAEEYERAARTPFGRIPAPSPEGMRLRSAVRLLALSGVMGRDTTLTGVVLVGALASLVSAVADLRRVQQHAAQAAAARQAANRLLTQVTVSATPPAHPQPVRLHQDPPGQSESTVREPRHAW
ncbi:relaxase/mobilization nuclease domain-containing protein [Microbispora bryophytorum]|uniref:Relaxase/mobilization nuclease domain-containing protein n=1 Tax=Microbispora bryophytorum subsp. camponoti TaxID=1677852 RepID=A0ABR8LBL2_9ACTN|nr:relaxase/mobilization nuclease domain-containing protein [Microbispora camponoti]MBD3148278.1 relaxase/mobilization nuclease domain-containing protein [Microbispora camponoti]